MRHGHAPDGLRQDSAMPPAIPESTKTSLGQRLRQRQHQRWPALATVQVRFRGRFAHIDGELDSGEVQPLCRLRHGGSTRLWGFAVAKRPLKGPPDASQPTAPAGGVPGS